MFKVLSLVMALMLCTFPLMADEAKNQETSKSQKGNGVKRFFKKWFIGNKNKQKEKVDIVSSKKRESKKENVKKSEINTTSLTRSKYNVRYSDLSDGQEQNQVKKNNAPKPKVQSVVHAGKEKIMIYQSTLNTFNKNELEALRKQK